LKKKNNIKKIIIHAETHERERGREGERERERD